MIKLKDILNEVSWDQDLRDLHFETDPDKQEEMKIQMGRQKFAAYSDRTALEDANYALRHFRKKIKYWDGNSRDKEWAESVFVPGHYNAVKSTLGDGPHAKKRPSVSWSEKKYHQWIEDMASGEGWKHSFDMAQNAKHESGLLQWVKRNRTAGEDPLERIQWDIEAQGE